MARAVSFATPEDTKRQVHEAPGTQVSGGRGRGASRVSDVAAGRRFGFGPVRPPDRGRAVAALRAELYENICREPLTPSEVAAAGRAIEALEKPAAKERQREGGKAGGKACGKLPQASEAAKTRDKVGEALGVSGKTYEKIRNVCDAADANPPAFADLRDQMDATGKVDAAHRQLRKREREAAGAILAAPR